LYELAKNNGVGFGLGVKERNIKNLNNWLGLPGKRVASMIFDDATHSRIMHSKVFSNLFHRIAPTSVDTDYSGISILA